MMDFILALWLPMLVSSVLLFIISSLLWMVSPHHKVDYQFIKDDVPIGKTLRDAGLKPGRYLFPNFRGNPNDPEIKKKIEEGPIGSITILPGMTMGSNLIWTYVFFLVTSFLLGYLGWIVFEGQTDKSFMRVFRVLGTAGVLTYTCSAIPNDIWYKRPLWNNVLDGILYGLASGLVFAALWPK